MQLYAAVVLPVLALHFDAAVRRLPDPRGIRAVFERDARRGTTAVFIGAIGTVMVLVALLQGRLGPWRPVPDRLDPSVFPIAAVDYARAEGIQGRIFHEFIWGGYLLYAWPEQRVFIDGGTDFYGPDLMRTFIEIRGLKPGWRETLANWKVSVLLIAPGASIANELVRDGDWGVRYCDKTAALLERDAETGGAGAMARLERCAADAESAPGSS